MITQHAACADLTHPLQHAERIGSAVDQVADAVDPVIRTQREPQKEPVERRAAPLDVSDEDPAHARGCCLSSGRGATLVQPQVH